MAENQPVRERAQRMPWTEVSLLGRKGKKRRRVRTQRTVDAVFQCFMRRLRAPECKDVEAADSRGHGHTLNRRESSKCTRLPAASLCFLKLY
jgi:hypothetical protein